MDPNEFDSEVEFQWTTGVVDPWHTGTSYSNFYEVVSGTAIFVDQLRSEACGEGRNGIANTVESS